MVTWTSVKSAISAVDNRYSIAVALIVRLRLSDGQWEIQSRIDGSSKTMSTYFLDPRGVLTIVIASVIFGDAVNAERKSVEKCKEYSKLVYVEEVSPVLRLGTASKRVSKCTTNKTPLIVGGEKATPAEFPHQAVIGFGSGTDKAWDCGGSIISESYILTAAHCLESSEGNPAAVVRVGLTNLKSPESTMQERKVMEKIIHPDYRLPSKYNDMALLKLEKPLLLDHNVRPACLEVEAETSKYGNKAVASGFGKTSNDETEGSPDLMKVQLDYVSREVCEELFKTEIGGSQLPEGMIPSLLCAGVLAGEKDTCQGDSGGPLQRILDTPYCMYSIVGVTSFGRFCASKDSPGIYSRVSSYLDWIESIVWP
ncbi:serine protease snake [Orussus abietinus]|uniref:serine protease snake n=1 Tax=Orussus abietinus TaxID=222816 RepID=UPI0006255400|nr:serine protease snake [Orussus abietinus]